MTEAAARFRSLIRTTRKPHGDREYSYAWAVAGFPWQAPDVRLSRDLQPGASPKGAVLLWVGTSESPVADLLQACEGVLSSCEIDRARSFRQAENTRSLVTVHAILRLQLSAHYHCSPAGLLFATGLNGNPHLCGIAGREARSWLSLSWPHPRGRTLVGPSATLIGVEQVVDFPDVLESANLVLTPESCAAISACSGETRTRRF